jgi:PAS domain S-box-containing protein
MKINKIIISKSAALLIVAVGLIIISGWVLNISVFKTLSAGMVSIRFNTAIGLILAGISVYLLNLPAGRFYRKWMVCLLAGIVLLTGVLNLSEYIIGYNLGIDELFWKQGSQSILNPYPGRQRPGAAIYFVFIGFILLVLPNKKFHLLVQVLLISMMPGAVLVIINHLIGVNFLDSIVQINLTSLPTAILFIVLFVGILYSKPFSYIQFTFQHKIAGFFALVLLILVIIFYAFKKNNEQGVVSNNLVKHTYEVLLAAELLNTNTNQIQSSARGYFLSSDNSYLQNVSKADRAINTNIVHLKFLTIDNPRQQVRIDSLNMLIYTYTGLLNKLIHIRKTEGLEAAREAFANCQGKSMFDAVRTVINAIETEENNLMEARSTYHQRIAQNSSTAILLFQVIIGLLLLLVFWVIRKNTLLRNKALADLQQSLKELSDYKYALNQSSMVVITDRHGIIKQVNDNLCKVSKYQRKELVGENHVKLNLNCNTAPFLQDIGAAMASGKLWKGELKNIAKDGTVYWKDTTVIPFIDTAGKPYQFVAVSSNITWRKALEAKIKQFNSDLQERVAEKTKQVIEKEEKYRFLLQNMREGILVIGHDWKYIFANNSVIDRSIYSSEDLLGYTMMEKHPGIEKKEIFTTLKHCMEQRRAQVLEYHYTFPDGLKGWLEMSIQPVPEGLLILSIDITDRKKAAKEIEQVNKKLEKKAVELEVSNNELKRFAFVASHDLQEPLRMITSFLNLLEKRTHGQLDDTTKKFIFFAIDGAERMRNLVQDLLEYSTVGANKEDFTVTDINDVMKYIKRVLEINLKQKNALLIVDPMPIVTVNKTLIGLLFLNLISNALKYHGPLPPEVKVGCYENEAETIFYVQDKGIGIDAKFFDKIFIIFQRLHTKDQYVGTGMGLAICKKITDIHHGNIWVESAIGMGSTFYFSIPKHKPDLEAIL